MSDVQTDTFEVPNPDATKSPVDDNANRYLNLIYLAQDATNLLQLEDVYAMIHRETSVRTLRILACRLAT